MKRKIKRFIRHAFLPYLQNPGGWNMDAILVIAGASVWAVYAVYSQLSGVGIIPEVSEIGKACIFVGIGRASKEGKSETVKRPESR